MLCLVTTAAAQSIATDEVDEFSGERRIVSEGVALQHEGTHLTYLRSIHTAGESLLLVEVYADSWQHIRASHADAVAYTNGEPHRFRLRLFRVTRDVRDGGRVYERYGLILPAETWDTVRTADRVRMRISGVVYTIPAEAQAEMRLVSERAEQ